MGLGTVVSVLGLVLFGQLAPTPPVVASRQRCFDLPFQLAAEAPPPSLVVELLVSRDRGATWNVHGAVSSSSRRFTFLAETDGEYWFALHTVHGGDPTPPPGLVHPELCVVVDTTPPAIHLQAERSAAGVIHARWQVDEPGLPLEEIALLCRHRATDPWQDIPAEARRIVGSETGPWGEAWWRTAQADLPLEIRAEGLDLAGNRGVSQCQVP